MWERISGLRCPEIRNAAQFAVHGGSAIVDKTKHILKIFALRIRFRLIGHMGNIWKCLKNQNWHSWEVW